MLAGVGVGVWPRSAGVASLQVAGLVLGLTLPNQAWRLLLWSAVVLLLLLLLVRDRHLR